MALHTDVDGARCSASHRFGLQGPGANPVAVAFRAEVAPVTRFAVDLALVLRQRAAPPASLAAGAAEAGLVADAASAQHLLRDVHRLTTAAAGFGAT